MDRSRNAANTSTRATVLIVVVCVGVLAAGVWFAIGFFHDGSKQRLAIERRNREGNENRNEGDGRSGFASGVVSGGGGESRYRKMIQ
jgi:hypothetical protein